MKQTKKIILALLVALTLFSCVMAVGATAESGDFTVYFAPDSNWRSDNARFAAYVWIDGGDHQWIELSDPNGDGIYEGVIPAGYVNVIFARLDPNDSHTGWSTKWNQTVDLTIPNDGKNLFSITTPWNSDDMGNGEWSKYKVNACAHDYGTNCICTKCGKEIFYIIAGNVAKIDGVYMDGDNSTLFISEWDVADENNRLLYDSESECYLKIYTNVAAGEYHFKVVEDKSWDNPSYGHDGGNCYLKVEENGSTVVITFKNGSITCAAGVVNHPDFDDTEEPDNSVNSGDSEASNSGSSDKNEEPVRLNFFQRIWQAIVNFFKGLFGGKNK